MGEEKKISNFEPLIKIPKKENKTSLTSKKVEIKGSNDFSRQSKIDLPGTTVEKENAIDNSTSEIEIDKRFKATLTQKISPAVNLKINTLKPFLGNLEGIQKTTVNEIIDLLLDNYINTKIPTRQQEAFNSMYKTQLDLLKK